MVVVATACPGTVDGCVFDFVLGLSACGPEMISPAVPPGWSFSRPVADTMRDNCSARLSAAIGLVMSRLIVRRSPTGETCALCWSVGANRRNHSREGQHAEQQHTGPRQPHASVRGGTPASSAVTQTVTASFSDSAKSGAGAVGLGVGRSVSMSIRTGSR